MGHVVVVGAERNQSLGVVRAAFAAELDVMEVDECGETTTRNGTAASVTHENLSPDRRWDRLSCAGRSLGVEVAEVLSIAPRALGNGGLHDHGLPTGALTHGLARRALAESNLIVGALRIAIAAQNVLRERAEKLRVVERLAVLLGEPAARFREQPFGLGIDVVEEDAMASRLDFCGGRRQVARNTTGTELLDRGRRELLRIASPGRLRFSRCYAGQLTNLRVRQAPRRERSRDLR